MTAQTIRSRWPMTALSVAVCGLAAACAPYPAGLAGIAAGVAGIGCGVVGVIEGRRTVGRTSAAAVLGIVVAVSAVAAGITLVLAHPKSTDATSENVLRDELEVTIGPFGDIDAERERGRLPVTFANRLGETAEFSVAIGAFDAGGHQIDSETAHVVLAANCSEEQSLFRFGAVGPLSAASFRVIAARRATR